MGFTRNKPKEPGVYFIRTDGHLPMIPAPRIQEHWDVAEIYFYVGDTFDIARAKESAAHWRVKTLDGIEHRWREGMWIKGPIHPRDALCATGQSK